MIISSLYTTAFRNLVGTVVTTNAKDIFLVGENGQGKTNFLEALYFCVYAASFRGISNSNLIQSGKRDFAAIIKVADSPQAETPVSEVITKFEKGKKTVCIDGKKIEDRKELLLFIPCIVFCHEDMEFVSGSPERRRWFFDQVLSLYDPVYLDDLRGYRRILKSRNSVLRDHALHILDGNPEILLDTLDQQYVLYGLRLMEKREQAAKLFSAIFESLYEEVSGIAGVQVRYTPSWKNNNEAEIVQLLRERRIVDFTSGISLSGPHRDRYTFIRGRADFAVNASTGQRRLLALLLRVAQACRFSESTGRKPILLLDDVLLEMDGEKRRRFFAALPAYDQAFFTFLPEEPFERYRGNDTLVYYVQNGRIEAEVS